MRQLLLLRAAIAVLLINGCSKDGGTPSTGNTDPSLKVKTITTEITSTSSYHYKTTATLSYDSQDRIIEIKSDSTRSTFTYENNLVKKDSYQSGITVHYYYYLKANSLLDSLIIYINGDTLYYNCLYNAKYQLVKLIIRDVNMFGTSTDSVVYEYNSDGNVSKITQRGGINAYEYSDEPNVENSLTMLNVGMAVSSKLLKKISVTYMGNIISTETFSYTFDDYNRIISQVSISTSGSDTTTYTTTYTYY